MESPCDYIPVKKNFVTSKETVKRTYFSATFSPLPCLTYVIVTIPNEQYTNISFRVL